MTSREQFEAWYSRETGVSIRLLKVLRACDDYSETDGDRLSMAWMAWQASREALKPVAWAHRLVNKHSGVAHPWVYGSAEKVCSEGDVFRVEVRPLYSNEES